MTFPEHAELVATRIERWSSRIMIFCAAGTCVCFAGMAFLVVQAVGQSRDGQKARQRQQAVMPVSALVYEDAYRRGVITLRDLNCFRSVARCPAP